MRIKNKAALVERAEDHKAADRFIADSYLVIDEDGADEFRGCEIGCLATPSDLVARKRWFARYNNHHHELEVPVFTMVEKIKREFGVCLMLQRAAECLLMTIPARSGARLGGFTVSFAKALHEGADIKDSRVREWIAARGWPVHESEPYDYSDGMRDPGSFLRENGNGTTWSAARWEKERKAFLDWCRRGCPKPKAVR